MLDFPYILLALLTHILLERLYCYSYLRYE
jgi:hypothetical protein